jgi:hypothetical protein
MFIVRCSITTTPRTYKRFIRMREDKRWYGCLLSIGQCDRCQFFRSFVQIVVIGRIERMPNLIESIYQMKKIQRKDFDIVRLARHDQYPFVHYRFESVQVAIDPMAIQCRVKYIPVEECLVGKYIRSSMFGNCKAKWNYLYRRMRRTRSISMCHSNCRKQSREQDTIDTRTRLNGNDQQQTKTWQNMYKNNDRLFTCCCETDGNDYQ